MATDQTHSWGSAPDFVGPRHQYRESLMLRQLEPLLSGRRILNAGAGGGSLTLTLLERGLDVTSVDGSEAFVDYLRSAVAKRFSGLDPQPPVEVGDLHALRFADETFDAIVCGEVLEHLEDDATAAEELARVLRPGGVLVASVPGNPRRYDWVDRWAGHQRRYTATGLEDLLVGAGFVDVQVTAWGFPLTGLYHRWIYRPMLARRLERGGDVDMSVGGPGGGLAHTVLRRVFAFDSLFLGKFPGWFGLLAQARKPSQK
jgi:SAM-dependent methyltransferase